MITSRFKSLLSSRRIQVTGLIIFRMESQAVSESSEMQSSGVKIKQPNNRVIPIEKAMNNLCCNDIVKSLRNNELIAVPTDTLYGLAGLAQEPEAVRAIYRLKRRSDLKPLAICVGEISEINKWCRTVPDLPLLEALLPGPVTLVMDRHPDLNPTLNPEFSKIGVRIPDHDLLREIVRQAGSPLALTSANISNQQSPLTIQEFHELWPQLAWVVDGGRLGETETCRRGSTVVDLSVKGEYMIIRDGGYLDQTVAILERHGLRPTGS